MSLTNMPRKNKTAGKAAVQKTKKVKKVLKPKKSENPPVETVKPEEKVVTETKEDKPKKRNVPTRETILTNIEELISTIDEQILKLRESSDKTKGVKFLRSVNKKLKTIKTHSARVMKQRKTTRRKPNPNSGFLKPVKLSKELTKFTGWKANELRSRVDVTKFICNYIKEKNLQNPEDGRQIRVENDPKLKKLLKYDSSEKDQPVTYPRLQTLLKDHFIK